FPIPYPHDGSCLPPPRTLTVAVGVFPDQQLPVPVLSQIRSAAKPASIGSGGGLVPLLVNRLFTMRTCSGFGLMSRAEHDEGLAQKLATMMPTNPLLLMRLFSTVTMVPPRI